MGWIGRATLHFLFLQASDSIDFALQLRTQGRWRSDSLRDKRAHVRGDRPSPDRTIGWGFRCGTWPDVCARWRLAIRRALDGSRLRLIGLDCGTWFRKCRQIYIGALARGRCASNRLLIGIVGRSGRCCGWGDFRRRCCRSGIGSRGLSCLSRQRRQIVRGIWRWRGRRGNRTARWLGSD